MVRYRIVGAGFSTSRCSTALDIFLVAILQSYMVSNGFRSVRVILFGVMQGLNGLILDSRFHFFLLQGVVGFGASMVFLFLVLHSEVEGSLCVL